MSYTDQILTCVPISELPSNISTMLKTKEYFIGLFLHFHFSKLVSESISEGVKNKVIHMEALRYGN